MQTKREIKRFIADNFLYGVEDGVADDASLLERGLIDSTGVLELVAFVEEKYGITFADHELVPDNLDSVNKLAAFIDRRKNLG